MPSEQTDPDLIERLDALHEAATPGPFAVGEDGVVLACDGCTIFESWDVREADPALIVALRNAWPSLREMLREKEERIKAEEKRADEISDHLNRIQQISFEKADERDAALKRVAEVKEERDREWEEKTRKLAELADADADRARDAENRVEVLAENLNECRSELSEARRAALEEAAEAAAYVWSDDAKIATEFADWLRARAKEEGDGNEHADRSSQ